MTRDVRPSPEVLFRELQGEAVLLDLRSQRYYGLDLVGTRIWQLVEEHGQEEAILEGLEAEFDASREQLSQDLRDFLAGLEERQLILRDASPAPGSGDSGDEL